MKAAKKIVKNDCALCPIAKVADLVGDHWTLLIIRDLLTGPKRYKDLSTSLSGISSRTLSKKLVLLEKHDMLTRTSYKETPPRVEYTLTAKGADLHDISEAMRSYGEKHL